MTTDAQIVIGIRGETSGGKRIKRTLDDIGRSGAKVTRGQKQLETQIKKTNRATGLLSSGILKLTSAYIALAGARGLARVSDAFVTLDTGLKNVTDSTEEYNRVFNSLFDTAQRNGDVFSGLADTFVKLNVSLNDNVKEVIDLTKVTELLSRGFAASGTNAATAAGASLQLTQGLATNFKSAGQELNSIIEGAPLLAKVIAIQLGGKGATDLKKFAEQGKLTALSFLSALIAAEDAIKAFAIPPTIGRSIQRVRNEFLRLVGESENVQSVAKVLSETLNGVAKNLDLLVKALFSVAALLLGKVVAGLVITSTAFLANAASANIAAKAALEVAIANRAGAIAALNMRIAMTGVGASMLKVAVAGKTAQASILRVAAAERVLTATTLSSATAFGVLKTAAGTALAFVGGPLGLLVAVTASMFIFRKEIKEAADNFTILGVNAGSALDKILEKLKLIKEARERDRETRRLIKEGIDPDFKPETFTFRTPKEFRQALGQPEAPGKKPDIPDKFFLRQSKIRQKALEETEKANKAAKKAIDDVVGSIIFETEQLKRNTTEQQVYNNLRSAGVTLDSFAGENISRLTREYERNSAELERQNELGNALADTFDGFFKTAITGADGFVGAIKNVVSQLADLAFQMAVIEPIKQNLFGGGGLGSLLGNIFGGGGGTSAAIVQAQARGAANPALFGPGFASGGSIVLGGRNGVDQNQLSLNGVPIAKTGRGEVLSISPDQKGGGNGVTINQTINVNTGVQETIRAEFLTLLPEIQKSTIAAVQDANARGFN